MNDTVENLEINKTWLRQFSRSIRPFKYSETLLNLLEFRLNDFESFKPLDSINIERLQIDQINLEFRLNSKVPPTQFFLSSLDHKC